MLHLIVGLAGTGKTTLLLERLRGAAQEGGNPILLVPEQYSFEAERRVHRLLGPKLAIGVEVLSFTRLCQEVFRAKGGLAGISVTQTARYLLMSLAAAELSDCLKVYRKSLGAPAFLKTLTDACAEFKTAGISPARLEHIASLAQPGALKDKLCDLVALYGAYQAMLERGYNDDGDELIRAEEILSKNELFAGRCVFVDGFTSFTAGERALLGQLIAQAREVHFTFTADGLEDYEKGLGVFSDSKAAMAKLIASAKKSCVPVSSPVLLKDAVRFKSPELELVSRCFLLPDPPAAQPHEGEPRDIFLYHAPDLYREVEYLAARISRLVREEGYRYREIAVVARELAPYLRAVESIFLRCGIPYFADQRRDVEAMPLAAGLIAAVEAVRSNLDSAAVLSYAKSPVAGLDAERVAELENYCYVWGVRGKLWEGDFKNNPRGLAGALNEGDAALLERINHTRETVISPLLRLREDIRRCDGRGFAAGIYGFLRGINAPEHLEAFASGLPQGERETFLSESGQLWDMLMDTLDVFGQVLGSTTLTTARFCDLLRLSLASGEVGMVPQTLDQVLVGKADRIRTGEVRAVFVIGAVEGEFPAAPGQGGIFTDRERRGMIELGAEIGAPSLGRIALEKYFCYHALTRASDRLYLSAPKARLNGEGCEPSVIISGVCELFGGLKHERPEDFELFCGEQSALELLAGSFHQDTPKTAALLSYFQSRRARSVDRMRLAAVKPGHSLDNPDVAREIFGGRMTLSPSRVERYYRCAFSYFASDGLKLRPLRRVEFNLMESGSVVHHVLQVMVQEYGGGLFKLPKKQMEAGIREIIEGYLAERIEQRDALPKRFDDLFGRLVTSIARLLRHLGEELEQSEFVPVGFELPINAEHGVPPLELVTADGVSVRVEGTVDRVDVMRRGERGYLRVVDYKSGGKEFRLDDVLCGLNLQMLLYLFTITENGGGVFEGCIPAGVLYQPVHARYISSGRSAARLDTGDERRKQWRMNGLLLDDEISLRGMERELGGVFIPAKMGADGVMDKKSALAGKAAMGRISRKIKALIAEMAENLSRGGIQSCPLVSGGHNPCEYCDYASLCGFEPGDAIRKVARMDLKDALDALQKEEDDVG